MSEISALDPQKVWYFFDLLCSVPHISKHEAAAAAKLAAEAEKAYTAAANNAAYQEAVRAEASYLLGCLYVAKNDTAKAQAAFKRAMVSKPTSQTTAYWSQLASRAMDRLPAGK